MDDIAGCRLIFPDIESLYDFREKVHKARFKHKKRNDSDKYDYIKKPKETGYRGVHDIYEYDVNSQYGINYKGLFVELQYRTNVQHAWATAVEVIGFITESQPKFQKGDDRYEKIMVLASEILARSKENSKGFLPYLSDQDLLSQFLQLDNDLGLIKMLRSLNSADGEISAKRNIILIMSEDLPLEVKSFRDATDALRALFELEKFNPGKDVVLVRADTSDEVRNAFRNYFSDAHDFIRMIDEGCSLLSGHQVDNDVIFSPS